LPQDEGQIGFVAPWLALLHRRLPDSLAFYAAAARASGVASPALAAYVVLVSAVPRATTDSRRRSTSRPWASRNSRRPPAKAI